MTKLLLAGPWVGEFGWELFCWQAHIRKLSKNFDKTIIISRPGHFFLYEDFAGEFYEFKTSTSKANMWLGQINQNELKNLIEKINYNKHIKPINIGFGITNNNDFITSNIFNQQEFIKYKSDSLNKKYDILIHPRNKSVGDKRNWSKQKWQNLVDFLKKKYDIAIIGTNEAFNLDGVDDYRNISIKDTVALMNRCRLVVGQSSGPLHLASLSDTSHFVWSDKTNRKRYLKYWNPFNTKCYFYDNEGWNPKVDNIYNELKKILK